MDIVITKAKQMEYAEGDEIIVTVDGFEYTSQIIKGCQRFVEDPEHHMVRMLVDYGGSFDPNQMSLKRQRGEFTSREYAEMNIFSGYSVDGFSGLRCAAGMLIINPAWGETDSEYAGMDNRYLIAKVNNQEMTLGELFDTIMKRDDITLAEAHHQFLGEISLDF
jgi:hypothetical protein